MFEKKCLHRYSLKAVTLRQGASAHKWNPESTSFNVAIAASALRGETLTIRTLGCHVPHDPVLLKQDPVGLSNLYTKTR